jgi:hypothetical protein
MTDAIDAPELLDVDVHELARTLTLIAIGGLKRLQPAALAEPDAQQHGRDGRERHLERLADLRRGHP